MGFNPLSWNPLATVMDIAGRADVIPGFDPISGARRAATYTPVQHELVTPLKRGGSRPKNDGGPGSPAPTNSDGSYKTVSGIGQSSSTGPSYDPDDLAYIDTQKAMLERQLGRTSGGLEDALGQILNSYNKERSRANSARSRALEDFGDKREISEAGRGRELGKVDTSARMLADSLRQRLGLASGSGSSAYQIAAPRAVQRQASDQRTDVLQDYSANFMNLDKDETRAKQDFESLLEDLAAQRREREGGVRGDIQEQRNEIRENLARLAGQRQQVLGGGYDDVRRAMDPYEDKIRSGEKLIDSIFEKYTKKYNVKPVNVRDTQLRDYATDDVAVRDNAATGNQSDYAPYKTYLDEEDEELY